MTRVNYNKYLQYIYTTRGCVHRGGTIHTATSDPQKSKCPCSATLASHIVVLPTFIYFCTTLASKHSLIPQDILAW